MKRTLSLVALLALACVCTSNAYADNARTHQVERIGKVNKDLTRQKSKQARKELRQLNKESDAKLKVKIRNGNPLAGLALAHKNSKEAQSLAKIPVLANSAAEDAVRWYNLAAQMGALQSQSVNGLNVIPLRATRQPKQ